MSEEKPNQYPTKTNPFENHYPKSLENQNQKIQYQSTSFFQILRTTKPSLENPGVRCPVKTLEEKLPQRLIQKIDPLKRGDLRLLVRLTLHRL